MGATIDIKGILKVVNPERAIGTSYTLVEIIVEEITDKAYKNYWKVQLWNDKIAFLDKFHLGDKVNCHCNLNGKKKTSQDGMEDSYFLTLNCFGIGDPDNPTTKKPNTIEGVVGDGMTFPDVQGGDYLSPGGSNIPHTSVDLDDEKDDLPF